MRYSECLTSVQFQPLLRNMAFFPFPKVFPVSAFSDFPAEKNSNVNKSLLLLCRILSCTVELHFCSYIMKPKTNKFHSNGNSFHIAKILQPPRDLSTMMLSTRLEKMVAFLHSRTLIIRQNCHFQNKQFPEFCHKERNLHDVSFFLYLNSALKMS